ncbi:MAG: hypothetical protein G8345_07080 [Magnetococcales bacterium]|nr:hypothetical protein [Magnetococcales bacterium]NGZ26635.1 hypothetical protein [Magnetococcales bacterium]
MAILPLNQVAAGMVVAKDVLDMSGRLLLGRATIVTEKHIKILKTWGITEVHVADNNESIQVATVHPTLPFPDNKRYNLAKEEASRLFPPGNHPLHQLIYTYATRSIYRRLERGGKLHGT